MIEIGKRLYAKDLIAACDGNISLRLDERRFSVQNAWNILRKCSCLRVNLDSFNLLKSKHLIPYAKCA